MRDSRSIARYTSNKNTIRQHQINKKASKTEIKSIFLYLNSKTKSDTSSCYQKIKGYKVIQMDETFIAVEYTMHYEIKKIQDITCIFAPMQESNSVTIEIMVKAGSIYETRENNGISHFLEHMFFKGGKKYTSPHAVAQAVDNFGGEFNAYTADSYAGYYVKCAPDFLTQAVDVLGDMMVDAQFPKDELEREKNVVIQEIKMYEDDPQSLVYENWKKRYVGDTSYGRSTLGPEENIKSFTQEDLFAHKESLYTKDNLLISIAGNIRNQDALEQQIADLFASLPSHKTQSKPEYQAILPQHSQGFFAKDTQQSHLIISAPGFTSKDEKRYAARLLMTILGGNMSSVLFQEIREKLGLCYYIGGSHSSKLHDGMFFIRAGIDKERFDFGIEKINETIERFARGNVSEQSFMNAQGYRIGSLQMGIESSDSMTNFLGHQYLMYGEIKTIEDIIQSYKTVQLKEVQALASMLIEKNRYLYYIK